MLVLSFGSGWSAPYGCPCDSKEVALSLAKEDLENNKFVIQCVVTPCVTWF